MRSGTRHFIESRPPDSEGRLLYSFAATLALAALFMALSLHLPHLAAAGSHAEPGSGHHAMHGALSESAPDGESSTAHPGDVDCHALPLLTPTRPDSDDPPRAGAWPDYVAIAPDMRCLAAPDAPLLPRLPGPDRQSVFQVYRL